MKTLISFFALLISSFATAQITFTPHTIDSGNTASSSHRMTSGDFDSDGDTDLFGATMGQTPIDGTFNLYLNEGDGSFTRVVVLDDPALSEGARDVQAIDVDGDGDLDVIGCAFQSDTILWFENDGSGNFTSHAIDDTLFYTEEPNAVGGGDFDNDGDIDVVSATLTANSLVIYDNDGNENFSLGTVLAIGSTNPLSHGLTDVKVFDLNQDGALDLISSADYGDTFAWWENDGTGNFTSHVLAQGGNIGDPTNAAHHTASADLDGDGDIDIAATTFSSDYILWFENDGNENFAMNVVDFGTIYCETARHISTTDLDRDGDIDLLTSALANDVFAWYENDGSGNFTPHLITDDPNISDVPTYIEAIDIAGDCEPEIIVAALRADAFTYFDVDGTTEPDNLVIAPKVYLQGAAINPNAGEESLMRDDLRVEMPLISPYADLATMNSSVLFIEGPNAIVDWIWVELRDPLDNTKVISGRSALLQRDGDIVDMDGSSPLGFCGKADSYHVAIHHRNHLPIITDALVSLSSTLTNLDFSANNTTALGGNLAVTEVRSGIYAMYSGDFNGNGQIQNTDASSLVLELGSSGYSLSDLDMNGETQNTDITNLLNPNIGKGQQF